MKLRNKKTGGLANIDALHVYTDVGWDDYDSLAELNEEWEDYEPLIKDEKIRKAVRAWVEAELGAVTEVDMHFTTNRQANYTTFTTPATDAECQFTGVGLVNGKELMEYTLEELCGEEE